MLKKYHQLYDSGIGYICVSFLGIKYFMIKSHLSIRILLDRNRIESMNLAIYIRLELVLRSIDDRFLL